jgi:hypothetical protein
MILYHGSNLIVEKPRPVEQNRYLDFGFGFYTTSNLEQARNFALKVVKRKGGTPIVNIYEFDEKQVETLESFKRFISPDEDWLDFVSENRNGVYKGENYGIIIGPVANDDVYTTLQLFMGGFLTREQTLQTLKIKKLYDQYVFATKEAMELLHFVSYEEVK